MSDIRYPKMTQEEKDMEARFKTAIHKTHPCMSLSKPYMEETRAGFDCAYTNHAYWGFCAGVAESQDQLAALQAELAELKLKYIERTESIDTMYQNGYAAGFAEGREEAEQIEANHVRFIFNHANDVVNARAEGRKEGLEDAVEIVRQEPIECAEWDDAITYHERKIIAAIRAKMGGE